MTSSSQQGRGVRCSNCEGPHLASQCRNQSQVLQPRCERAAFTMSSIYSMLREPSLAIPTQKDRFESSYYSESPAPYGLGLKYHHQKIMILPDNLEKQTSEIRVVPSISKWIACGNLSSHGSTGLRSKSSRKSRSFGDIVSRSGVRQWI